MCCDEYVMEGVGRGVAMVGVAVWGRGTGGFCVTDGLHLMPHVM